MRKLFSEVSQCQKNCKGVSSGIVCYAGNLFGSVPWANRGYLKFCRTFGRTILVTSGVSKFFFKKKKKQTKSHDYSQLFSRKAPTKKTSVITIHMPQKWILSSSVKCLFRKTRTNRILVKQSSVFIVNFDAQCNQKLRKMIMYRF